jgi:hypothetical protein
MKPAKLKCITQKAVTQGRKPAILGAAKVRELTVKFLLTFSQDSHFLSSSKEKFHSDCTSTLASAKTCFEQQPSYF